MQVSEHVHAIRIPFQVPVAPGKAIDRFVYAWLIGGEHVCLVDSGVAGAENAILEYLAGLGRQPADIARLVLTHSHPDHIGAARAIVQAAGCTVAAHPAERAWIEDVELQARQRPVPGFTSLVGGSVPVDRLLEDGNIVPIEDGLHLEVLHTPGHSPGSISFYLPQDRVLISGDAIPVPGDLPIWTDLATSVRSVERLAALPAVDTLLASWDAPRCGQEIRQALQNGLCHLQRIAETTRHIATEAPPANPMDLCRRVVTELGLPPAAANPLVARSLAACLEAKDQ